MKRLLIVERDDLIRGGDNLSLDNIRLHHLRHEQHDIAIKFDMVMFMDLDGELTVLKSRYPIRPIKKL